MKGAEKKEGGKIGDSPSFLSPVTREIEEEGEREREMKFSVDAASREAIQESVKFSIKMRELASQVRSRLV